jgi:acyl dehydratase
MPIANTAAGAALETREEQISVRRLLAYAAGIGDVSPATLDDDRESGVMGSPPFCVSLEWPVVSSPHSRELLDAPGDELRRGVHASQDSFFHRAIRPGDRLRTEGTITAVEPTRAGALVTMRLATVEAESGEVVVTSWSKSIYRGVDVAGGARVLEAAPTVGAPPQPEEAEVLRVAIAREMPHVYTECAQIWNPIHTEREVALAAGLPDIILHGTATWALAGREIVRLYAEGDPSRLRRLHGRFRAMVIPGSDITVEHSAAADGRVFFAVRNEAGEPAVSHGLAEIV